MRGVGGSNRALTLSHPATESVTAAVGAAVMPAAVACTFTFRRKKLQPVIFAARKKHCKSVVRHITHACTGVALTPMLKNKYRRYLLRGRIEKRR
jgi:hypothetical protein